MNDGIGVAGEVVARLYDKEGNLKQSETGENLVLDRGINYLFMRLFSRLTTSTAQVSSSSITYKPYLDPFAHLLLGYNASPVTPTATESNGETNSNVTTIHQSLSTHSGPKIHQTIKLTERQNYGIKAFTIGGIPYFAVTVYYHADYSSFNSCGVYIYKFDTTTRLFVYRQKISVAAAVSGVDVTTISGDTYLAFSCYKNDASSYSQSQYVYKWDNSNLIFTSFQTISSGGTSWGGFIGVKFLTLSSTTHLLFTDYYNGSSYTCNSKLFYWTGSTFSFRQDISAVGANGACSAVIESVPYLFISNSNSTTSSPLLKWNAGTTNFDAYQTLAHPTSAYAANCDMITFGSDSYLAVSWYYNGYSTASTYIYKWNGTTDQFEYLQAIGQKWVFSSWGLKFTQMDTSDLYLIIPDISFTILKLNTSTGLFEIKSTNTFTGLIGANADILSYDGEVYLFLADSTLYGANVKESTNIYKLYPDYGNRGALLSTAVQDDFTATQDLKENGELGDYLLGANNQLYTLFTQNISKTDAIDINSTNAGYLTVNLTTSSSTISTTEFTAPFVYLYTYDDFTMETYISHTPSSSDYAGLCIRDGDSATNSLVYIVNNNDTKVQVGNAYADPYGNYLDTYDHTVTSHKYLKITRSGSTITVYSKANVGDSWTQQNQLSRADFPKTLQIGLIVFSSSSGGTYVPKFDYLKVNHEGGPCLVDITRTFTMGDDIDINTIGLGSRAVGAGTYQYPNQSMQWGSRVNINTINASEGDTLVVTYRVKLTG